MAQSKGDLVRVLHMPSGISASCACERGQFRNRQKALSLLRARLYAARHVPRIEAVARMYEGSD